MTRAFISTLLFALVVFTTALAGTDQTSATPQWQEGVHYEQIKSAPARSSASAITVTEWFWLGCPHCYALEPYVLEWERRLPKDVTLKRVAVAWDKPERVAHAKLYYTLEALGRADLRQAAFDTIHRDNNRLFDPRDEAKTLELMRAFAQSHQLDPARFLKTYASAAAAQYVSQSNDAALAMHVLGVPSVTVDGRFTTDIVRAGGPKQLFELVDYLVEKERRGDDR